MAEWKHVSAARFQNLVENPPRGAEAKNGSGTITDVGRLGVHLLLLFVHQNKYSVVVLNVKLVCLFQSQKGFQKFTSFLDFCHNSLSPLRPTDDRVQFSNVIYK